MLAITETPTDRVETFDLAITIPWLAVRSSGRSARGECDLDRMYNVTRRGLHGNDRGSHRVFFRDATTGKHREGSEQDAGKQDAPAVAAPQPPQTGDE